MPTPLSPATIDIVRSTVPALETHGLAITRRMYERMFENEAIRGLFNQSHQGTAGTQPKAVAAAVLAYARHINNPGVLADAVERIAQKHVALDIRPEHYPHVGNALLGAIKDVLGDAATEPVMTSWAEAYGFLADVLIGREAALYQANEVAPGGWTGWRDFAVENVTPESEIIRSFVLVPVDGGRVLPHQPGQYLGCALDVPGVGSLRRNYSISSAPSDRAYRISVKREAEPGRPAGVVSNWLHDNAKPGTILRLTAPAGEFVLDRSVDTPVVLLSGGVGLTPMLSMLATIAVEQPSRKTWFVHGARHGRLHALAKEVRQLASGKAAIRTRVFYEQPDADDVLGRDYDAAGLISADWLEANTPLDRAVYYVCGPVPFLRIFVAALGRLGVPQSRIRYEFFGPAEELVEAPERLAA